MNQPTIIEETHIGNGFTRFVIQYPGRPATLTQTTNQGKDYVLEQLEAQYKREQKFINNSRKQIHWFHNRYHKLQRRKV